jgi:hypothetical protein
MVPDMVDETTLLAAAMPAPPATDGLILDAPLADAPSFPGAPLLLIAALAAAAAVTLGGAVVLYRRQAPAGRRETLAATVDPGAAGREGRP